MNTSEIIYRLVQNEWRTSLIGASANTRALNKFMRVPVTGEMAVEVTSGFSENSIGTVVSIDNGRVGLLDEFVADNIRIARLCDGGLVDWHNCQFVRVPTKSHEEIRREQESE